MPQFPGSITDKQADAIVNAMFDYLVPTNRPYQAGASVEAGRSTVAAIICDAVSEDITLQPLHEAYGRKVGPRQPLTAADEMNPCLNCGQPTSADGGICFACFRD